MSTTLSRASRPTPAPAPAILNRASGHGDAGEELSSPPTIRIGHIDQAASGQGSQTGQPAGARMVAWSAFCLGIAASVAANVAHARPGAGPRIAGAFVPLALLLAVECMSRPAWHRTGAWWGLARYGGTGLVALVAAVMSYRHMSALLVGYGEDPLNAAIGPLAVDGLMVVAGFALLAMNTTTATASKEDDR